MNDLQIFNNEEFGEVRTVLVDSEPWFVASDICKALGHSNPTVALQMVEDDERTKLSLGRAGETNLINESGMYALILRSNKPNAKKFRKWVTSEILPSIRKTGGYHLPHTYKEALESLLVEVEKNEQLSLQVAEMTPKAQFFDAVADSSTAIDMGETAKVLKMGRNKLFAALRNHKVLMENNVPYQKYIDKGWFRVIECTYQNQYNEPQVVLKTLVYQKGVDGIRKVLNK